MMCYVHFLHKGTYQLVTLLYDSSKLMTELGVFFSFSFTKD